LVEASKLAPLETVAGLSSAQRAQCLNYLRATRMHLRLLINFGHCGWRYARSYSIHERRAEAADSA
jgi:hypothetical protein